MTHDMFYRIEKDIPIPPHNAYEKRPVDPMLEAAIAAMKIGESILITADKLKDCDTINSRWRAVKGEGQRLFTERKQPDGSRRIWRRK